ncbi:Aminopeptidase N [Gryllus bimaculatus]|nr:Aminopeptidase N [Gryllus bimaculatus]
MSTYLLAFILYEEASFTKTDQVLRPGNPVPYSTWGRRRMLEEDSAGQLSQVEGPAAIDFLERYTGIKYNATMTKMDMAAIPDFASGAMENWALVTYREVSLLYNQKWWSSIWLNEGFARYLQYLVVHERYPNWRMLERFVLDEQMGVFGVDADEGAAPITDDTWQKKDDHRHPERTRSGAILRQIRNVMGEENFIAGVQAYLKARYLADATPDHLFDELVKVNKEEVTKLNNDQLKAALTAWSETAGYPVITVTREGNSFNVSQERFLLTGTESSPSTYPVYLTYYSRANETVPTEPVPPQRWLRVEDSSIVFEIENISSSDWVLFNVFQGGYYRVNYDEASWERLGAALDGGPEALARVAPLDRAAVVDNALALARAGRLPYKRAFALLRFLRHDTAFEPWAAARAALAHLQRMVGDQPKFQKFVWYIVEKAYNATGFDEGPWDAHLDKVHRTNVLSLACSSGYEPCLAEARRRLLQHLSYLPLA